MTPSATANLMRQSTLWPEPEAPNDKPRPLDVTGRGFRVSFRAKRARRPLHRQVRCRTGTILQPREGGIGQSAAQTNPGPVCTEKMAGTATGVVSALCQIAEQAREACVLSLGGDREHHHRAEVRKHAVAQAMEPLSKTTGLGTDPRLWSPTAVPDTRNVLASGDGSAGISRKPARSSRGEDSRCRSLPRRPHSWPRCSSAGKWCRPSAASRHPEPASSLPILRPPRQTGRDAA